LLTFGRLLLSLLPKELKSLGFQFLRIIKYQDPIVHSREKVHQYDIEPLLECDLVDLSRIVGVVGKLRRPSLSGRIVLPALTLPTYDSPGRPAA
jgi:hypothetical protein